MKALLVIGILLVLFWLIGRIRVGAEGAYSSEGGGSLKLRVAGFSIRLGGRKTKPPKPEKESEKPEDKPKTKKERPGPPPLPVILSLVENGFATLCRIVSRLRVELLRLHVVAAQPDPADAAMLYAAIGTAMDGLLRVGGKNILVSDLRADVDFDRTDLLADLRIRVTIRIGQIVSSILRFGLGFLKDFIRYKRSDRHG